MRLLAIFGPTAVGKTGVAIEVAELLRRRGEDPCAVSCDALQLYRELEPLTGAPTATERARLEHRLVGVADPSEEWSAGRFATLAHAEIDELLAAGRRPIVVGGTGLYLRAALADLDLRPPVPAAIRDEVERELAERGSPALHAELPADVAAGTHPNDRKRVARLTELRRAGIEPHTGSEGLWTRALRRPAVLVGIVVDRAELRARISARVAALAGSGAGEVARRLRAGGASRTALAALGVESFASGDIDRAAAEHAAYARRQLTWMRRMQGVEVIDRTGLSDGSVAELAVAALDRG